MPIKFKIMERANPRDPGAAKKHYAVAHSDGEATLRQLSERIAEISTVSSIDTLAVLESLLTVIPRYLLDGKIVRLGDFGS
jgi:predicted histone-like DNA-binding protein